MTFREANDILKESNITEDDNSLTYKAGVIFFVGSSYKWDEEKIFDETPYDYTDIRKVLTNWKENDILVDGKIIGEFDESDQLAQMVEFTLICMCGAGDLCRTTAEKKVKQKNMSKKTLNDHLFEQLERISECNSEEIPTEIDRTNAMIAMSEQILNVARLKMEIIQSNSLEQFSEIDIVHSEVKQLEDNTDDEDTQDEVEETGKKKLTA